jgi:hypothetical protein
MANATGSYQKRFCDLDGLYADAARKASNAAAWGERIVYEVSEFRPTEQSGDLIFGVTRMAPGKVGDEYFMTRGHIHRQADRPEIYYGQKGHGLMLMESPEGEVRILSVDAQTVCYVPPFLDPPLDQCRGRRSGDAVLLSGRFRAGLRDHREIGRHALTRGRRRWRLEGSRQPGLATARRKADLRPLWAAIPHGAGMTAPFEIAASLRTAASVLRASDIRETGK